MKADSGGTLLAHYAVPLVDETGVYMVFKTGTYAGFGFWDSIVWTVRRLRWTDGALETVWTFESDWKPEPLDLTNWEPVFLPAISGSDIYVPGLGGTVFRVSKETGVAGARVNPFGSVDPARYVAGGLAAAADGSILYNVLGLATPDPRAEPTDAWLVRVRPDGTASRAAWATLTPGPRLRPTSARAPSRKTRSRGRRHRPPCRRPFGAARRGPGSTWCQRSLPTAPSTRSAGRTPTAATRTSSPCIPT
jgi:hypothetical protein